MPNTINKNDQDFFFFTSTIQIKNDKKAKNIPVVKITNDPVQRDLLIGYKMSKINPKTIIKIEKQNNAVYGLRWLLSGLAG